MDKRVGFVCFGEVNTPIERLQMKHDEALDVLKDMGYDLLDAGLVIDDEKYATADAAAALICAAWSSARQAGSRRTPSSA